MIGFISLGFVLIFLCVVSHYWVGSSQVGVIMDCGFIIEGFIFDCYFVHRFVVFD